MLFTARTVVEVTENLPALVKRYSKALYRLSDSNDLTLSPEEGIDQAKGIVAITCNLTPIIDDSSLAREAA
jgi:hypothetical protein